jgi:hypothetical protein
MPRALVVALLTFLAGPAAAAEAGVSVEIPPGELKTIRLRNIPLGTTVAVRIVSSGRLLVALVGGRQLKPAAGAKAKTVFRGMVEGTLSFKVTIPEKDDYYLVLNNRRGTKALSVEADIRAEPGRRKRAPTDYSGRPEKASWSPR